jgi:hypothetical protein
MSTGIYFSVASILCDICFFPYYVLGTTIGIPFIIVAGKKMLNFNEL